METATGDDKDDDDDESNLDNPAVNAFRTGQITWNLSVQSTEVDTMCWRSRPGPANLARWTLGPSIPEYLPP